MAKVIALVVFIFYANTFLFVPIGTCGFLLFWTGWALYCFVVRKDRQLQFLSLFFYGIFSFILLFRANSFIQALAFFSLMCISGLMLYRSVARIQFVRSFFELLFIPLSLFGSYLLSTLNILSLRLLVGASHAIAKVRHIMPIVIGVVLGVPIVLILVVLLSHADPVFAKTINQFLPSIQVDELFWRVMFSVVLACIALPIAGMKINKDFVSPFAVFFHKDFPQTMTIVMTMVGLTVLLFIGIQWPYVFVRVAEETNLSQFGVATYSEYVKRGFIELLFVASLLYSLVWAGLIAMRSAKGKSILRFVQSGVIIFLGVFIFSVFRRILLYWEFHGLSLVRVYGGVFLGVIFALTIVLFFRHFVRFVWVRVELAILVVGVLFLGFWNAEAYIVSHHPPTVNKQIDYVYLSRMSPDGYLGWKQAYEYAKGVLNTQYSSDVGEVDRKRIANAGIIVAKLSSKYEDLIQTQGSPAQQNEYYRRISEHIYNRLNRYKEQLEKDKQLLSLKGNTVPISLQWVFGVYERSSETKILQYSDEIRAVDSVLSHLNPVQSTKGEKILVFSSVQATSYVSFSSSTCKYYQVAQLLINQLCFPSFYRPMYIQSHKLNQNFWQHALVWNITEKSVFNKMQSDMPLNELIALQERYFELFAIIAQQKETAYSQDISFDTPFLAPL